MLNALAWLALYGAQILRGVEAACRKNLFARARKISAADVELHPPAVELDFVYAACAACRAVD